MSGLTVDAAEFEALAAEILLAGSALRFRARGISMAPFIHDGDIVDVQPIRPARVRTGDIVLATVWDGRVVVHRVIGRGEHRGSPNFLLQGDALARPDGYTTPDGVLGRVRLVERGTRRIVLNRGVGRWAGLVWIWTRPVASRALRLVRAVHRRRDPLGEPLLEGSASRSE